jgi:hypothetical protein
VRAQPENFMGLRGIGSVAAVGSTFGWSFEISVCKMEVLGKIRSVQWPSVHCSRSSSSSLSLSNRHDATPEFVGGGLSTRAPRLRRSGQSPPAVVAISVDAFEKAPSALAAFAT